MKLIVMIPAYNEANCIGNVIRAIPKDFPPFDKTITVVVDDGSSDETAEEAQAAGADKVLKHGVNLGVGAAFRTGLSEALRLGADVIVNIDGDDQFDTSEIPRLVGPIIAGTADCVVGSRFLESSETIGMPRRKRFGNRAFTRLVNWLANSRLTDTQSGFRAYSREAALRLNLFGRFTYTQESLIDLLHKGQRVTEIPVRVRYDPARRSRVVGSIWTYALRAGAVTLRAIRDLRPLAFFGSAGALVTLAGILSGLFVFVKWVMTGATSPYRSLIDASVVLLTIGSLTIFLGLTADMIGRQKQTSDEILYLLKKHEYSKPET
jgi:glycosyltransferase involved in cell wall biosynthesis